jgi:hypothetical protein
VEIQARQACPAARTSGRFGQSVAEPVPHETLIQEYLALPLKDTVKDKWLYRNAARVFGLE